MGVEDDLSEEEIRKMEAKLLGSETRKGPVVEIRRRGRGKPEPVELRFVDYLDDYDGEWMWTEVQQKASSGWIKVETFEDRKRAARAYEKYERGGDKVSWVQQRGGLWK